MPAGNKRQTYHRHSAKELNKKEQLATQNAGGGAAGLKDRKFGGAAGHSKFQCPLCFTTAHDLTAMRIHYESKHSDVVFDESIFVNRHELFGGSTQGVAVRGSLSKTMKTKSTPESAPSATATVATKPVAAAVSTQKQAAPVAAPTTPAAKAATPKPLNSTSKASPATNGKPAVTVTKNSEKKASAEKKPSASDKKSTSAVATKGASLKHIDPSILLQGATKEPLNDGGKSLKTPKDTPTREQFASTPPPAQPRPDNFKWSDFLPPTPNKDEKKKQVSQKEKATCVDKKEVDEKKKASAEKEKPPKPSKSVEKKSAAPGKPAATAPNKTASAWAAIVSGQASQQAAQPQQQAAAPSLPTTTPASPQGMETAPAVNGEGRHKRSGEQAVAEPQNDAHPLVATAPPAKPTPTGKPPKKETKKTKSIILDVHQHNLNLHPMTLESDHTFLGIVYSVSEHFIFIQDTFDVEWTAERETDMFPSYTHPVAGDVVEFERTSRRVLRPANVRKMHDATMGNDIRNYIMRHPFLVTGAHKNGSKNPVTGTNSYTYVLRGQDRKEYNVRDTQTMWIDCRGPVGVGSYLLCGIGLNVPEGHNFNLVKPHHGFRTTGLIFNANYIKGKISSTSYFVLDVYGNEWCFFGEHFTGSKNMLSPGIFVEFEVPPTTPSSFDRRGKERQRLQQVGRVCLADAENATKALDTLFPRAYVVVTAPNSHTVLLADLNSPHSSILSAFKERFIPSECVQVWDELRPGMVVGVLLYQNSLNLRMFRPLDRDVSIDDATRLGLSFDPIVDPQGQVVGIDVKEAQRHTGIVTKVSSNGYGFITPHTAHSAANPGSFEVIENDESSTVDTKIYFHKTTMRENVRMPKPNEVVSYCLSYNPSSRKNIAMDVDLPQCQADQS